ncbi:MAG TPA: hypothetical protein VGN01_06755 [Acidobacteriaceae bacterium]|jgi:hypothetical protein
MRLRTGHFALMTVLAVGLAGCGGSEPSESQMKDAMSSFLNHPVDGSVGDPIKVASFKKGACDKPTAQGVNCTFTMAVTSANPFAQMFNNLPSAVFYKDKDSGNWMMRAPF